jgi:hypothetical protein
MTITAVYAGLLGLLFLALTLNVVRTRQASGVSLGDGDDPALERRIRAHGNFAEYVPLALILIAFVEAAGGSTVTVHGLGLGLLAGRLMHGFALSSLTRRPFFRIGGIVLTIAVVAAASVRLLVDAVATAAT